ncbi:MAG: GtrA family protein [Bacteroidales bacterium]|nr:GtrA family protein [Bacteroidales bacterium]
MNIIRSVKICSAFKGKTDNTLLQLFRYGFVGGIAFLVDFGTLFVLTEYIHFHYLLSAAIGFIFGLIVNYLLSIEWVFNNRTIGNRWLEFLFFTIIGLIGLGLNELFLWILTDILAVYYLLSKIITTILVYFWNFFARKALLFNKATLGNRNSI